MPVSKYHYISRHSRVTLLHIVDTHGKLNVMVFNILFNVYMINMT